MLKSKILQMKIKKFQAGGQAPVAPTAAPAGQPAPQEDPLMILAQMFAEGLQSGNCELLAQGAEGFLQIIQGGGEAPVGAPAEEPMFKRGGKMIKKEKGGSLKDKLAKQASAKKGEMKLNFKKK